MGSPAGLLTRIEAKRGDHSNPRRCLGSKAGQTLFDIRASYVSYSFVVVSWLKGTDAVGRFVPRILFSLSQRSWM